MTPFMEDPFAKFNDKLFITGFLIPVISNLYITWISFPQCLNAKKTI